MDFGPRQGGVVTYIFFPQSLACFSTGERRPRGLVTTSGMLPLMLWRRVRTSSRNTAHSGELSTSLN